MIQEKIKTVPSSFTLQARDPAKNLNSRRWQPDLCRDRWSGIRP